MITKKYEKRVHFRRYKSHIGKIEECINCNIYKNSYPIGLLEGHIELHFLHHNSEKDRCKDVHIEIFDKLPFKHKNDTRVYDGCKSFHKYYNIAKVINNLK